MQKCAFDIFIVSTQIESTFTTFTIKTVVVDKDDNVTTFLVDRRYSEFEELYNTVIVLNVALRSILPQFPRKNPFKNSERVVEERRNRFDNMMAVLSQYESIMSSSVMRIFLGIDGDSQQTDVGDLQTSNKSDFEKNMEQFLLMGGSQDRVFEGDQDAELLRLKEANVNVSERISLLKEILSSEVNYVKFMSDLYFNYYKPVMDDKDQNATGITPEQGKMIFPPMINDIHNLHCAILSKLHMRYGPFLREENESTLYFMQIGDIFSSIAPLLSIYVPYLRNYDDCISAIREYRNTIQPFDAWLAKTKKQTNGFDITALLIMVVQRIPRYIIFLQNLIKVNDPDHIDVEQLKDAISCLSIVMNGHNEQIRKGQMYNKMCRLADKFNLELDKHDRQLLTEAVVWTTSGTFIKDSVKYTAYLFNDMILLDNESSTSKPPKIVQFVWCFCSWR
ncbi:hypothetical protein AKO1_009936 [Acrasis kona]|uniref:DH domain-containing protein n=1 Tax=Acrasis kona TaxID=1008807 RepID=A0AAW2ZR46_9EUKA